MPSQTYKHKYTKQKEIQNMAFLAQARPPCIAPSKLISDNLTRTLRKSKKCHFKEPNYGLHELGVHVG